MANFEENREANISKGGKDMKIIKFTALALMLVIAFTAFAGCAFINGIFENGDTEPEGPNESVLLWQAEINVNLRNNISPEFAENNKIKAAYEYNDPERENAPDSLSFIVNDKEAFEEIFATAPFEVDFENETVLLYTYTTTTATPYVINDIFVDEHTHTVSIDIKHQRVNSSPDHVGTCEPTQNWLAVKMKKVNATEVEFY